MITSDEVTLLRRKSPLSDILDVFPDAKESFVNKLLLDRGSTPEIVATIIQHMVENGYEKREAIKKVKVIEKRDINSINSETSELYRKNSIEQLQNDFPYLKIDNLRNFAATMHYSYYPVRKAIEKAIGRSAHNYGNQSLFASSAKNKRVFPAPRAPTDAEQASMMSGLVSLKLATKKNLGKFIDIPIKCPVFAQEMEQIRQILQKECEESDRNFASELNEKIATEEGNFQK